MGVISRLAAISAAFAMTLSPAQALAQDPGSALKLRELDIMLMVSALRCRFGPDGFQADYDRFSTAHVSMMNEAGNTLKADLSLRYGAKGAVRELDRISVGLANRYGQGHPWLDCAGLKQVTEELARETEPLAMLAAAENLLAPSPPARMAQLVRR